MIMQGNVSCEKMCADALTATLPISQRSSQGDKFNNGLVAVMHVECDQRSICISVRVQKHPHILSDTHTHINE